MRTKKCKAIISMSGKKVTIPCSIDVVKDGQKVMLVRNTNEPIVGKVTGKSLGMKKVVVGVGRTNNQHLTISSPLGEKAEVSFQVAPVALDLKSRLSLSKIKQKRPLTLKNKALYDLKIIEE